MRMCTCIYEYMYMHVHEHYAHTCTHPPTPNHTMYLSASVFLYEHVCAWSFICVHTRMYAEVYGYLSIWSWNKQAGALPPGVTMGNSKSCRVGCAQSVGFPGWRNVHGPHEGPLSLPRAWCLGEYSGLPSSSWSIISPPIGALSIGETNWIHFPIIRTSLVRSIGRAAIVRGNCTQFSRSVAARPVRSVAKFVALRAHLDRSKSLGAGRRVASLKQVKFVWTQTRNYMKTQKFRHTINKRMKNVNLHATPRNCTTGRNWCPNFNCFRLCPVLIKKIFPSCPLRAHLDRSLINFFFLFSPSFFFLSCWAGSTEFWEGKTGWAGSTGNSHMYFQCCAHVLKGP